MMAAAGTGTGGTRRVVLVTRRTRLDELVARHHTLGQARFYLEHLGADFGDYLAENEAHARALRITVQALQAWGRWQVVDRSLLPNFVFSADDIVVALGPDGLVANTLKYLQGQPLIGLNPEPSRWDGLLLPYAPADLAGLLPEVALGRTACRRVSMAEARLSDGQVLRAVNDLFIGPRSHTSAWYELQHGARREWQSSSGLIVATGLGSTAWLRSVVTGSLAISSAVTGGAASGMHDDGVDPDRGPLQPTPHRTHPASPTLPWDSPQLVYAVREPFPSRRSGTTMVYGCVQPGEPLQVLSGMPEHGVIFSDGIESDYLRFTAGMTAQIGLAAQAGVLVR